MAGAFQKSAVQLNAWQINAALSALTGTASITLGSVTATASGIPPITGAVGQAPNASLVLDFTGNVYQAWETEGGTLGAVTLTSSGLKEIWGSTAATLDVVGVVASNAAVILMPRHIVEVPTVEGIRWTGATLDLDFVGGSFTVWEEPTVTVINPRRISTSGARLTRLSA